ncbi:GHMP family kinase ATP-binding protein [Niveispirillum cyanobacteriorum]|uniref:Dehydrogenase n=1 Tax=Niveispirillum cyanobacteriorum TaxID=1612173 RepID=A0A2K9NMY7_9PROT|nr:dehydrogenase [Niveispirillum cyanobacteriorum]AUN33966.1 dehydrogenase [Niveispirillum cyanobacteriorum]GGE89186.1 dehydrogenase [Niveispirillum cyanobacteriorum]
MLTKAINPKLGTLIRARAPLRLGLAGGGTDISPYCDVHSGAILNITISMFTSATLELTQDGKIVFEALDRDEITSYDMAPYLAPDGKLDLHKAVYNRIVADYLGGRPVSLRLRTSSDAVAGSGLGSSSTLVVTMAQAFVEAFALPLGEYDVAHMSYVIERKDLGLKGGKQDQYAATFGGFNFMEFYAEDRVIVNPLRVKDWIISELESSLVLYFTGVSRESANIIAEQVSNVENGNQASIDAMHALRQEAVAMKEYLLRGDIPALGRALQAGWEAKKRSANSISNPAIDAIDQAARKAGAFAGKMSGAGGGGFMFFLAPPECRQKVIKTLEQFGGTASACYFTAEGAKAWRV